jgi:ribosomal protein S18 acetylase RimI-like enzyme
MRCQIEGIRVLRALRGLGIGTALLKAAEKWAVANGCSMLQLLVHRDRSVAQRFYHALGFEDMHLGLRKPLRPHGALNPRGD